MREDRHFRVHFAKEISRVAVPANPWRPAIQAKALGKEAGGWQAEIKPSWMSVVGYAFCALCLVVMLGIQGLGIHRDVVAEGWAQWLGVHPVDAEVAAFLDQCRALL